MDSKFLGKDQFIWWKGVVEDRKDPIMLGRVKVRIFGWHSEDPQQIPTQDLPWASVSTPLDSGRNPVGLKEGDWVWGFFMDGPEAQKPVVVGVIPGIDEKQKPPELGFGDPTRPEDIRPDQFPRPPDLNAQMTPDSSSSLMTPGSTSDDFFGQVSSALTYAADTIQDVADTVGTEIDGVVGDIVDEVTPIINDAVDVISDVGTQIEGAIGTIVDEATGAITPVVGEITGAINSAGGAITGVVSDISRSFNPITGTISEVAKIVDPVTGVVNQVTRVLDPVTGVVNQITRNIDPVTGVVNQLSSSVNQIATYIDPVTGVTNQIIRTIDPVTGLVNQVSRVTQPITNAVNQATGFIATSGQVFNSITGTVNQISSTAGQVINPITGAVNQISGVAGQVLNPITGAVNQISGVAGQVAGAINNQVSGVISATGSQLGQFIAKTGVAPALSTAAGVIRLSSGGRFFNTDRVPGSNIAFGELAKYYDPTECKFDINRDGVYDLKDATIMIASSINLFGQKVFSGLSQISSIAGSWINKFLDGFGNIKITPDAVPPVATTSPYPLVDRLNEPTTSRLARGEKTEETIVALKKGTLATITTAAYEDAGVATQATIAPAVFDEPETPYNPKYPFNHVYESECGHFVEIDDTPGAERLHWYHRSGTFTEIHPDGTQVTKVKKADYNFVVEDYFCCSEKSLNLSAVEAIRAKADQTIVFESGSSFNRKVGENDNLNVEGDANTRVKGTSHNLIEEEMWTHISSGAYFCVKNGDLHIKAKNGGKILIDADGPIQLTSKDSIKMNAPHILMDADDKIQLKSKNSVALCASSTTMQGPNGGLTDINMVSMSIRTIYLQAHTAILSGAVYPGPYLLPTPAFPAGMRTNIIEPNKADNEDWYKETTEDASKKFGFVLPKAPDGTVWKPVSDSDKNLCTLAPPTAGAHKLYEAIPTGQLEAVKIAYEHPDGQRTEWEVVRPVHKLGKEITNMYGAPRVDTFLDGRALYRWPVPGKVYPKQLFFVVGAIENFILDSAIRHQASLTGFSNDSMPDFDLSKPGPEAGKEEEGTASPKYGYLFPRGTAEDVYKPTSDSDGNLVTLSAAGDTHELYEAVETDEKQTVRIKYLNISQTITEWTVTRPVYKRGNLIESPRAKAMFMDGKRHMCRFSKPGSSYPKNMFLLIKKNGVIISEHFIIESGSRHQYTIGYDEKITKAATPLDVDNSKPAKVITKKSSTGSVKA